MKVSKLIIVFAALLIAGVNITAADTQSPPAPSNPSPYDGAVGVSINTMLSWQCNSSNPVMYDVYLDTQSPPAPAAQNLTVSQYNPGTLLYGVTYYWQVVSKNGENETASPVWTFTTARETDQQQTNYTAATGQHPVAQSFVPDYDTLESVELLLDRINDSISGTITVKIADSLNGDVFAEANISISSMTVHERWSPNPEFYKFTFSEPLNLTPQNTYYIIMNYTAENGILLFYNAPDSYSKGEMFLYNSTSEQWEEKSDWDIAFKTHGYNNFNTTTPGGGDIINNKRNNLFKLPFTWFAIFAIIFILIIGIATSAFFLKPESIKALGYAPAAGTLLITVFIAIAIFMYYAGLAWYWIVLDVAAAVFILYVVLKILFVKKRKVVKRLFK